MNEQPKGYASLVSAIIAGVSIVAGKHPEWAWVHTLSQNIPATTDLLNYAIPLIATAVSSLTHPFAWLRNKVVLAGQIVRGKSA